MRQSFVPARFFDDVSSSGATVFPGVPFMFDYLCRHWSGERAPRSLRLLVSAAAPIRYEVVDAVKRQLGLKIHSFYGTSETGGIAYDDLDRVENPVSMGRALPGVSLTLYPERHVQQGRRLHVRSDAVATGYADCAKASVNSAFCDGGFLTGDIGYFDEDSRVFLTGRSSRFVNVAGRKVHPEEVEGVLGEMEQVDMARVFGVTCETRGETLVACIVPSSHGQLDASTVRRHCAEQLAAHKIPRQFVFLDTLPLDDRGKTDFESLKTLVFDQVGTRPLDVSGEKKVE
jgi:long-chain acyl-CoA synthetase